jgi:hypothetical protein
MQLTLGHHVFSKTWRFLKAGLASFLSLQKMPQKTVSGMDLYAFMSELTNSIGLFINVERPANISREKPLPVLFVSDWTSTVSPAV